MSKGKWKITKFWDTICLDVGKYAKGWNYEVAFWIDDDVINEEYFEDKEEAEQYLEYMKEKENE